MDNYKSREDFVEHMVEIYNLQAAKYLESFAKAADKSEKDAASENMITAVRHAEEVVKVHEYSWLIKGFYELKQGNSSTHSCIYVSCDCL